MEIQFFQLYKSTNCNDFGFKKLLIEKQEKYQILEEKFIKVPISITIFNGLMD